MYLETEQIHNTGFVYCYGDCLSMNTEAHELRMTLALLYWFVNSIMLFVFSIDVLLQQNPWFWLESLISMCSFVFQLGAFRC